MVTVKDIMYFLNTETDYPKWKGERWNQFTGEYEMLTEEMLKQNSHIYFSFPNERVVKMRVSDYSFTTDKDIVGYDDYTTVLDKDLSKQWREFMAARHPGYIKKLKEFAEKRLAEYKAEYDSKKAKAIKKIDEEYQTTIAPFKEMLELANKKVDDDKELD